MPRLQVLLAAVCFGTTGTSSPPDRPPRSACVSAKAVTARWPEEAQDPRHHAGHMHFPTAV